MRSALITAENLKITLRACDGVKSWVFLPAEAKAVPVEDGWIMTCGPYTLRSARERRPRVFRTLDALVRAAKECGIDEVQVTSAV